MKQNIRKEESTQASMLDENKNDMEVEQQKITAKLIEQKQQSIFDPDWFKKILKQNLIQTLTGLNDAFNFRDYVIKTDKINYITGVIKANTRCLNNNMLSTQANCLLDLMKANVPNLVLQHNIMAMQGILGTLN